MLMHDHYVITLAPELYQTIKASFNPLNFIRFIKGETLRVVCLNDINHQRIELEMSPKLWRNLYKGFLYHETAHVKDMIYNQNCMVIDIPLCQAEREADAHVKKPDLIKASLAYLNFLKILRIYGTWPRLFSEHEMPYGEPTLEYLPHYDTLYEMGTKVLSLVQNQAYSCNDFHPSENERIKAFEKGLDKHNFTGNQEVTIKIYHKDKLQHTLVLKENENFSVEKAVQREKIL